METILAVRAAPQVSRSPSVPVAVKALGTVFAVQQGDLTSLVRITPAGPSCDCAWHTQHHRPCVHIALATRFAEARQARSVLVADQWVDGMGVTAMQLDGTVRVTVEARGQRLELRPVDLPSLLRALDRVGQRLGVVRR
jgi:hypothetical protein